MTDGPVRFTGLALDLGSLYLDELSPCVRKTPVRGELIIHERNQLLSFVTELPLLNPFRL